MHMEDVFAFAPYQWAIVSRQFALTARSIELILANTARILTVHIPFPDCGHIPFVNRYTQTGIAGQFDGWRLLGIAFAAGHWLLIF